MQGLVFFIIHDNAQEVTMYFRQHKLFPEEEQNNYQAKHTLSNDENQAFYLLGCSIQSMSGLFVLGMAYRGYLSPCRINT